VTFGAFKWCHLGKSTEKDKMGGGVSPQAAPGRKKGGGREKRGTKVVTMPSSKSRSALRGTGKVLFKLESNRGERSNHQELCPFYFGIQRQKRFRQSIKLLRAKKGPKPRQGNQDPFDFGGR